MGTYILLFVVLLDIEGEGLRLWISVHCVAQRKPQSSSHPLVCLYIYMYLSVLCPLNSNQRVVHFSSVSCVNTLECYQSDPDPWKVEGADQASYSITTTTGGSSVVELLLEQGMAQLIVTANDVSTEAIRLKSETEKNVYDNLPIEPKNVLRNPVSYLRFIDPNSCKKKQRTNWKSMARDG